MKWPDVEAVLVAHLAGGLDGVHVSTVLPNPRPAAAVTVRSDGGPSLGDVRGLARFGVTVWAETDEGAADLASSVAGLITGWTGGPVVSARAGLPYRLADESGQPSMYLTGELVVRGELIN